MRGVRILLFCAVLTLAGRAQTSPARKPSPPDIFLITIDTLRADHVHCYGYDKVATPAIDGLAKDGIRFSHAFTPSPITNTSHTTILTGLLPIHHGVTDFAVPLDSSHLTLAEMLKKKGYHTGAFIGAVILDSKTLAPGLGRGFDYYENFPEHTETKSRWGRVERRGVEVVKNAETWLDTHPVGPHFVWVHLYDPHDPYEPPAPYSETYKNHLYDGEIAYADSALANFLAYVKKQGWYENALVIVVGDHGEGLGEHHENTHGIFLYDSTTHVPLIVKLPAKSNAGKVVEAQVRTMDIVPTALDLIHAPTPSGLDGASLKPYFAGDTTNRTAYGETDYPLRFGWAPLRSVRAEGFKLIQAPRPELYDLSADPGELKNAYDAGNSTVVKYQQLLAALYSKAPTKTASGGAASESAKNDLKALGYAAANASSAANSASLPDPKDKIEEQNLLHTAMMASDDNRSAEARTAFEQVLQLDPKSPTALRQLGELELQTGDYAKAADHLKRAREVRPEDATAAFYEGQARNKIGDFAGARDALEASLKLTPGQLEARLLLGDVYLSLKDPKAAEDQFEAAQLLDSNSVAAQVGSARAQVVEGNYAVAVEQLVPMAKSHPDDAQIFDALSKAYAGMGKTAEAQIAGDRAKSLYKK